MLPAAVYGYALLSMAMLAPAAKAGKPDCLFTEGFKIKHSVSDLWQSFVCTLINKYLIILYIVHVYVLGEIILVIFILLLRALYCFTATE